MPYRPDPELAAFIQSLPKTETHIHLEGSMPLELCRRVDPVAFAEPPPYWRDDYRFDGFAAFQEQFDNYFFRWYVSPENYHESCVQHLRAIWSRRTAFIWNVASISARRNGPKRPMRDIARAIHAARPPGLELRLFLGMFRDHYHNPALAEVVDEAITWDEIAGVDLHGFENPAFQPWSEDVWARARANGKVIKAHAGEFSPAEDVRQAVVELGVRRVQHGLSALDDPAVMELLREHEVTLDMTPISNVKLRAVPSMREHPIRRFMEAGVRCTISTDDPMVFGNSLKRGIRRPGDGRGPDPRANSSQIAENGFAVADLPADVKAGYLTRLREIADAIKHSSAAREPLWSKRSPSKVAG